MENIKIKNLVICSTLNQITNYLIIKRFKPEKVFNITFDKNARELMNSNIKIEVWDEQLQNACKDLKGEDFEKIELGQSDIYSFKDIEEKIREIIEEEVNADEEIYWHITGGQRTIALAVSEIIRADRQNDKIMYIEGNTEKLIISDYSGEELNYKETYGDKELTFEKAFNLVGFKTNDELESTRIFKSASKPMIDKNDVEYEFYRKLYRTIIEKNKKYKFDYKGKDYEGVLRDLLLKSNTISKDEKERSEYTKELFKCVLKQNPKLASCKYNILEDKDLERSYPAGYIFEKLTAYKIYDVVKNMDNIVDMRTSLKTYHESEKLGIIDELDIVLLTDTGKIINFECKSGGMTGDNAKSHNYTTYRLSGVFGMPILLSPLFWGETTKVGSNKKELEKQIQAFNAATRAELEVWTLDENFEEKLKKLIERKGVN